MNTSPQTATIRARSFHCRMLAGLAAALFAMLASPVHATIVIAPGFPQMVARAERIFTASVSSVQSRWTVRGGHRCIVTTVAFNVEQMHKGTPATEVQLEFLGGSVGQDAMEVRGVPKFQAGERVILFSENNGKQFCPLVGIYHGKLVIEHDTFSGQDIVLRHDRQPVTRAVDVGSDPSSSIIAAGPAALPQPLSVGEFVEAVNKELQRGARP